MMRKYWWGYNEDHSKPQWIKWENLTQVKDTRGLGFIDFQSFNLAMLAYISDLKFPSCPNSKTKVFPSQGVYGSILGIWSIL